MKLVRWTFLFVLLLPVTPLFGEAQESNPIAVSPSDQLSTTNSNASAEEAERKRVYQKAANQEPQYDDKNALAKKYLAGCDDKSNVNAARVHLALMYSAGWGVPQDFIIAYKWWNMAAADGLSQAGYWRDRIAKQMTPDQIAEAQRLCREFKPRQVSESDSAISDETASGSRPSASGTGFFITEDGYLISNYHVVKDAAKVRLLTSAGTLDAKVVQVDEANDLALLKTEGNFSPLPVVSSRKAQLGNTVATVGFPNIVLQGFAPKLAKGEIAALSGAADDARYFQVSVPVQPGNSGGALVDDHGNVVGPARGRYLRRPEVAYKQ